MPRPKIITAASACSPCNPDCFVTDDEPDQNDIDNPPDGITSNNVEFVVGPPRGIRPIPSMTTTIGGVDTDMDGVPDAADDCPAVVGTEGFFGCPTSAGAAGFFHVLPPGTSAVDPLSFSVELREADIYVLIDRTGSMGDEITNLRNGVVQMITDIRATIPDTWFGIGRFDDLVGDGFGTTSETSNRVYRNVHDLSPSIANVQTAVSTLTTVPSGGDWPEANSQALYSMVTGDGLNIFGTQYVSARTGCPAGRWGYPCFRPSVIPIVILITDAESHNGPTDLLYHRRLTAPSTTPLANGTVTVDIGTLTPARRRFSGSTNSVLLPNTQNVRCGTGSTNDTSRDRYITFNVPTAGTYRFDMAGTSYDAIMYLYNTATPLGAPLQCDRNSFGTRPFIERTLAAGDYTLRIDGHSNDQGNFQLAIYQALIGNNLVNVGDISGEHQTYLGSTAAATNNFNTRCDGGGDGSRDRLVQFEVTTAGLYDFDLLGSSFDTYMYLYSGTAPTAGLLECDDDDAGDDDDDESFIQRQLTPGTYTLRIDGHSSDEGTFQLVIAQHEYSGVSYADSMAALNARGVRFIGVNSGNSVARADLVSMGNATGSTGNLGLPFVYNISGNGSGLTTAVVSAVEALAQYSRMDVDVVVENVNILPGVPASALVQSITLPGGCPARCSAPITNGCSQCLPNTTLPFTVTFANNVIPASAVDQVFNFDLIVRGNLGSVELQRVPVRILVPANAPTTTYMAGTFSRTFDPDAEGTCEIPPTRPDWGLFGWEVSTPGNSSVVFQFRTAETEAELNGMSPITYAVPAGPDVPTAAQYIDVGSMITAAGGQNYLPFLRVTAVLNPTSDGLQAPTLTSMGLQYGCVDSE
ncbi:MAG: VWA domain-containing protein [Sandaracinaceae bacterium]|nr:VWA domain-containing protein [Sandaracinaceae bacterium]MBK8589174.1 VWA domain-containing protein [Sandaracinaceae bacterium]